MLITETGHVHDICKIGTRAACRYLKWLTGTWHCLKVGNDKGDVDKQYEKANGYFGANGDNCEGYDKNQAVPF